MMLTIWNLFTHSPHKNSVFKQLFLLIAQLSLFVFDCVFIHLRDIFSSFFTSLRAVSLLVVNQGFWCVTVQIFTCLQLVLFVRGVSYNIFICSTFHVSQVYKIYRESCEISHLKPCFLSQCNVVLHTLIYRSLPHTFHGIKTRLCLSK